MLIHGKIEEGLEGQQRATEDKKHQLSENSHDSREWEELFLSEISILLKITFKTFTDSRSQLT